MDDIYTMAKDIQNRDYELLEIFDRVVSELCDNDIEIIKEIINIFIDQNKNHNENQ